MRFASSITDEIEAAHAVDRLCQEVQRQLEGMPCHLLLWFVSLKYRTDWGFLANRIRDQFLGAVLVGCSGGGVIGSDRELESVPAMSLLGAHLPEVEIHPFHVTAEEAEETEASYWLRKLQASPEEQPCLILLPEPHSCDSVSLVAQLEHVYPGMAMIGGLASGAAVAGENILILNDEVLDEGAVGVVLSGNIRLDTIVSQGCRPIGRPFVVTEARENLIFKLAGMPATTVLLEVLKGLPKKDQFLARHSLFIGIVSDELKDRFERGDFLIRNMIGVDPDQGILAIGDRIDVGQTVQFQLRDAAASHEDLTTLLSKRAEELKRLAPAGAVLFSCLGRGKQLYGEPHHDVRMLRELTGSYPVGGFFCNGEIGPISGKTFIHGFTSSIGFFRRRTT